MKKQTNWQTKLERIARGMGEKSILIAQKHLLSLILQSTKPYYVRQLYKASLQHHKANHRHKQKPMEYYYPMLLLASFKPKTIEDYAREKGIRLNRLKENLKLDKEDIYG